MKSLFSLLMILILLLNTFSCLADTSKPALPDDMLPEHALDFAPDQRFKVYNGPGTDYDQAGNGKAVVSTNDWIRVFGIEGSWIFIQYGLSGEKSRFGWIEADVDTAGIPFLDWTWEYSRAYTQVNALLTDDPFGAYSEVRFLPAGTHLVVLHRMKQVSYVETAGDAPLLRGFIDNHALTDAPVPYQNDPNFVSAYETLQHAGIAAAPCGLYSKTIHFSLASGGQASYYYYWDFSRYEMGNWRFADISDEDAARFLDYNIEILAEVERGEAPEEHLQKDYQDDLGMRNIEAVVSNGLLYLEAFGQQGLDILLNQLSRHDGNDKINSLRARLASRILGRLDITPVPPEKGCAWYDALTLAVQDDLPKVKATIYVEDPTLAQVTQLLIDRQYQDTYWHSLDVDGEKACNIVYLHAAKVKETNDHLTIWGAEEYSKFVLYNGSIADEISGHYAPLRIELNRDQNGNWQIEELIYAQDGSLYAPSILEFCDGNKSLANQIMDFDCYKTRESFQKYLRANEYDSIPEN